MSLLHTIFEETPVEQQALLHLTFLYFHVSEFVDFQRVCLESTEKLTEVLLRVYFELTRFCWESTEN